MRRSACLLFFRKYLHAVSQGCGDREEIAPALQFVKRAKEGAFDRCSDEYYEIRLREAEELSAFWSDRASQKAIDVLRAVLENIEIDRASIRKIAEILSECYLSSADASGPEDPTQGPDAAREDLDPEKGSSDAVGKNHRRLPSLEKYAEKGKAADEGTASPKDIYDKLKQDIYGQENAVKAAAMLLYNHKLGRKRNLLFIGQTGCGKTEIWRVCRQLEPCIRIIDSTMITGEGWKGSFKIKNIFDGMSRQEAERSIIVFDEFDKLCEPQITSGGSNASLIVQNEMLKLIEGTTVNVGNFDVDTAKISFVFCGSFEHLTRMKAQKESKRSVGFGTEFLGKEAHLVYDDVLQPSDLVKYAAVRQEIAGRIDQIVQLSPMKASDYHKILKNDQISPLRKLERQYGIKLCLDGETERKLVQEAEETRMGVRYLHGRIQQMLDEQMFQDHARTEYRLGA